MGRGARETLTRGEGVVQGGETAARVQERRRLHGKTPEQGAPPGKEKEISPDIFKSLYNTIQPAAVDDNNY